MSRSKTCDNNPRGFQTTKSPQKTDNTLTSTHLQNAVTDVTAKNTKLLGNTRVRVRVKREDHGNLFTLMILLLRPLQKQTTRPWLQPKYPAFSKKSPLFFKKCPLFFKKCPLFFKKCPLFSKKSGLNPNRSLDRYCAICHREYNFLSSFICWHLVASSFST